jgi:glycosyltransferase involved in cell wall biosynthesis
LRVTSLPFPPYPAIRLSLPYRRRVARFLDSFQPDVVHVATEGPLGWIGRGWALRHRVPLATSFHTHFPQYARHYGAGFLEPLVWRWLLWFHGPARFTHTPGAAIRNELIQRGLTRARVWGHGVDSLQFRPERRSVEWRRSLGVRDDQALVIHVGRLAPEKNIDTLVAAWRLAAAELGDRAAWLVAGEGPEQARIRAALPMVRCFGFLERDVLAALYASADLCVLPSRTETCGLVALEAMAAGVPVIAADAGGFRESVRSGRNGILAPPTDATAFARAIAQLVDDAPRRATMAAAARETAVLRDVRAEDADLLAQYRALTGVPDHGAVICAA